ncbi:hypothetical protein C1J03_14465 [Sulfitobacter sp. SK012]|nr:hypothetical protein C1J03_14465 [Sulfitobacter sp. SK012]
MTETLDTIFPECSDRLILLRKTDAGFDEIVAHFEIILTEFNKRFGDLDGPTADLIASFEDLRREIEKLLRTARIQGTDCQ